MIWEIHIELLPKGITIKSVLWNIAVTQRLHQQNKVWKEKFFFLSSVQYQVHMAMKEQNKYEEAWNSHLLQTLRLQVVSETERHRVRSVFFIHCLNWRWYAQMDQKLIRNFLHWQTEKMVRMLDKTYSTKWWLCWKIDLLHFDRNLIILLGLKLILWELKAYLSISNFLLYYLWFA